MDTTTLAARLHKAGTALAGESSAASRAGDHDRADRKAFAAVAAHKAATYLEQGGTFPGDRHAELLVQAAEMGGILMRPAADSAFAPDLAALADSGWLQMVDNPGEAPFYLLAAPRTAPDWMP